MCLKKYIVSFLAVLLAFGLVGCDSKEWRYETNNLADYGYYPGGAQEFMTEYINRFFPQELSEDFQDIRYTFRASEVDEYAFEAYLEFTMQDEAVFEEHVRTATEGMISRDFPFDKSYQEYVLCEEDQGFQYDHIQLGEERTYGKPPRLHYQIHYAKIAKILVNEEEQRIIYVALALHDGGGEDTGFLHTFFDRFGIDPKEYEQITADY